MVKEAPQLAEVSPRRRRALWLAAVAVLVGAGLFVLWRVDPQQVGVPLCALHRITGLHCPGCGATRATHELLHGRLLVALRDNALWVLSLPLVLYAAASEMRRVLRGRALWGDPLRSRRLLTWVAVAAAVFGVARNIPCYPFELMAPPGTESVARTPGE